MNDALMHWCRIAAIAPIARVTIADSDTTVSQFSNHNLANSLIFSLLMESLKALSLLNSSSLCSLSSYPFKIHNLVLAHVLYNYI